VAVVKGIGSEGVIVNRGERFAISAYRSSTEAVLAFALYLVASFAFVGWRLVHHPGRDLVGYNTQRDPELFVWSFAWWPHAISSWTNPFVTHAIYAPVGIDLAWTTSVPALAVSFWPVTALFGPAVSYNLASLLLPVASAGSAFVLCRYLTGSAWAAFCGGYLFGFSSFMLGHEYGGDLNFTGASLVPLMLLVLVKYVRGEIDARKLVLRLGLLLSLEFWISTEVVVLVVIALLIAIPLGLAVLPAYRARLRSAVFPIAGSVATAAVAASPLIYYAWVGARPTGFGQTPAADLLNVVVPTRLIELGGSTFMHVSASFTPNNDIERGVYLGIPIILILMLLGYRQRHAAVVRYLLGGIAVAVLLSFGSELYVRGGRQVALPWKLVSNVSFLTNLQPQRFALFIALGSALGVALWIGSIRGRVFARPYVLPICAVASLLPSITVQWTGHPPRRSFFTTKVYEQCIPKGETIVIFPFGRWGDSMLWQAESGFWFNMAEGNMGHDNYPPRFVFDPVVSKLQFQVADIARLSSPELRILAASHSVERAIAVPPAGQDVSGLGSPTRIGDAVVAPGCGQRGFAHVDSGA
jgi:hypothetical protein